MISDVRGHVFETRMRKNLYYNNKRIYQYLPPTIKKQSMKFGGLIFIFLPKRKYHIIIVIHPKLSSLFIYMIK